MKTPHSFFVVWLSFTWLGTAIGQWTPTTLDIDAGFIPWSGGGPMVFSGNGEHLFVAGKDKIDVYRTADGKRTHELRLPPREAPAAQRNVRTVPFPRTHVRQLTVTLGGKKLLVVTNGRVFLVDMTLAAEGRDASFKRLGIPDTYKGAGWYRYVCSVGDDRMVFIDSKFDSKLPRQARLVVYRISTDHFDDGAGVELGSAQVSVPQLLCSHYFGPHTFLTGESESGAELLGIRIIPDHNMLNTNMFTRRCACTYEKLKSPGTNVATAR